MTVEFRRLLQRLAVLSLIACMAFSFGSVAPAFAQADITAPDGDDASDEDSTADGDTDTEDFTNETSDDGDTDTEDFTNETSDDGDLTDVEDSSDDLTDVEDSADDLTDVEDSSDDGDLTDVQDSNDDTVEELPTTGQGSSQDGNGLELSLLATVLALVAGAFAWTRRPQRS